jgi:protein-tyrosine kinase
MDFIQAAIERAREERRRRAENAREAPARPRAPHKTTAANVETPPDRETLWAELTEFRPRDRRLERNLIVSQRAGPQAKHFDMIRTRLLHQLRANDWRRVAITSPGSACGKTTLALNLALSLGRQPDLYTLLAEFDLRRPSVAELIGLSGERQFSNVLAGEASAEEHLVRIGSNLALATNRHPVPDAAELLQGVKAGLAMDAIEAKFAPDVVICDMPPLLLTDDTMAFIDQIDCVLLVAAAERTNMDEIEKCSAELAARCNFLGVVLNKCRYLDRSESYGYGYGY